MVWGYKWDGEASGHDMIVAIAKADPRLVLLTQYTGPMGYTIDGIGYSESTMNIQYNLQEAKDYPRNALFRNTRQKMWPRPFEKDYKPELSIIR